MITYSLALKPQEVAEKVIGQFYPELDRPDVKFVYVFTNKKDKLGIPVVPKRKGKEVWGEVKVVTGLNAFLSSDLIRDDAEAEPRPFFAVLINQLVWNHRFDDVQREAFIDSLLCRCEYDLDKDKIKTGDFDVKEYHQVIKRRGSWHPELETFMKVAKQMPLPGVAPATRKRRVKAATAAAPVAQS